MFSRAFETCKSVLTETKFKFIVYYTARIKKRIFVDTMNHEIIFYDEEYASIKECVLNSGLNEYNFDSQFINYEFIRFQKLNRSDEFED